MKTHSTYLQPRVIATTPDLSLASPNSTLLFVIASPVISYYHSGSWSISIETVPRIQAWSRLWRPQGQAQLRAEHRILRYNPRGLISNDNRITEATGMALAVVEERGAGTDSRDPRVGASP